jgi:hypothetical protein
MYINFGIISVFLLKIRSLLAVRGDNKVYYFDADLFELVFFYKDEEEHELE